MFRQHSTAICLLEESCTKTFQSFSALEHHLDNGKHEWALERETLLDKAAQGYAARLDEQFARVQIRQYSTRKNETSLPMSWALKSSMTTRGRFNEKQKQYLMSEFNTGESTGNNANPVVVVAKSMRIAKYSSGQRLFTSKRIAVNKFRAFSPEWPPSAYYKLIWA